MRKNTQIDNYFVAMVWKQFWSMFNTIAYQKNRNVISKYFQPIIFCFDFLCRNWPTFSFCSLAKIDWVNCSGNCYFLIFWCQNLINLWTMSLSQCLSSSLQCNLWILCIWSLWNPIEIARCERFTWLCSLMIFLLS